MERGPRNVVNKNDGKQPCVARTLCPFQKQPYAMARNSLMLWGSLVLQRRKDLVYFTNGPTFSVLVMLRIVLRY